MDILIPVLLVAGIGLLLGLGLSVASVLMSVPVDEKAKQIRDALPGANCGSCGFSGCDGYAAAIAAGKAEPDKCAPGGASTAEALSKILGVEVKSEAKIAAVSCNGGCEHTQNLHNYSGVKSCKAANMMYSGPSACKYGCIGLGDCVSVCDYGAISVKNGVAVVDRDLCRGCGKCIDICPKGLIKIHPADYKTLVVCSNPEKGAVARKQCTAACIGCMKCVKVCESSAVTVSNNLAVINDELCTACYKCADECPQKCIKTFNRWK